MPSNIVKRLALACAFSINQSTLAEVPEEYLETPTAQAFGAPPSIGSPLLSPDGTTLAFIQQDPLGVSMLRTLNLADGSIGTLLRGSQDGYDIEWCEFANETRLLCELRQGFPYRSPDYLRYFAVNLDGSDLQDMIRGSLCSPRNPWRDAPKIDWLPEDPEHVMFICGGDALMLNVYSRRVTSVSGAGEVGRAGRLRTGPVADSGGGPDNIRGSGQTVGSNELGTSGNLGGVSGAGSNLGAGQQMHSNERGLANIYGGREEDTDRWFIRDDAGDSWRDFLRINPIEWEAPFRPVGYGTSQDHLFHIDWDPDTEAWALFRKRLTGDMEDQLIFAHGAIDVEVVDTMGPYNRLVAVAFLQGRTQRAIVDRRVAEVFEYVAGLLPAGVDIEVVDESWDQNAYLVKVRPPGLAGEFILVNMEAETVQSIAPEYEHLSGYLLAETRLIEFEGSDGKPVAAHLTLPHDLAGPVPAVVIPRDNATGEDVADPHYLVQFLAASGYAVLRVMNRVDEEIGGGGWNTERSVVGWNRAADDIADGISFLIDSGFSEAGHVCVGGKDFGAYTALMTAIKHPSLVQCIISIAGLTDPRLTLGAITIRAKMARIGEDLLDEASPVSRVNEINAPVLIFHGENDPLVDMADHAVTLANRLERADKDVVLVQYPYGDNDLARGPYRIDMLSRIRGFLAEHIGPELTEEESLDREFRWRPGG